MPMVFALLILTVPIILAVAVAGLVPIASLLHEEEGWRRRPQSSGAYAEEHVVHGAG